MNRQERTAFTRAKKGLQAQLYIAHRAHMTQLDADYKAGALNGFEHRKLKTKCPKMQDVFSPTPRLLPERKNNPLRKSLLNLRECARTGATQTSEANRLAKIQRKKELKELVALVSSTPIFSTAVMTKKSLKPKKTL